MGQRANLITIEQSQFRLFYNHWCAASLPEDLFWGSEHAVRFIQMQREVDETGWLDDVWAEGGVVVDCDQRIVLFFGGQNILVDIPLRRKLIEMMRRVWIDWDVRWAFEGIVDIAEYVGQPRTKVLSGAVDDEIFCTLKPPQEPDWLQVIGSLLTEDGALKLYPLQGDVASFLLLGPELLHEHHKTAGLSTLLLEDQKIEFPTGGFHIDLTGKTLDYWAAEDLPGIPDRISEKWAGWKVTWRHDDYAFQMKAAQGALRLPFRTHHALQESVRTMLLRESDSSMAEKILKIRDRPHFEGQSVEINPFALRDDRLTLDMETRLRILASVCDP